MPDYRWSHYLTAPWELVDEWYHAVKVGIFNLIHWFPVVWADRNDSYRHLLNLMRHKLMLMQRDLCLDPYYRGVERDIHRMHVCELLIERYLANNYYLAFYQHHTERWGGAS